MSVIENTIKNGVKKPGKVDGTIDIYDSVNRIKVIVNKETGNVITIFPKG